MLVKVQRALLSVYDKTGITDFAKGLHDLGVELLSTGGTAKLLEENGLPVTRVSDYTCFPEVFGGRLKTLHPKIQGGILLKAGRDEAEAEKHGIKGIQLVAVNLYPFEEAARKNASEDELVENVDVGGPAMIRAAAKNFESVAVLVDPKDYAGVLRELKSDKGVSMPTRRKLMLKAFARTSEYDSSIYNAFAGEKFPEDLRISCVKKSRDLRYGENPHQKAALYSCGRKGLPDAVQLSGKLMSYNNFVDADAALSLLGEFKDEQACIIVKHTNPCGGATGGTQLDALKKALETDSVSAFGGAYAFSKPLGAEAAGFLADKFVEIILAPGFDDAALALMAEKKKRILLDVTGLAGLHCPMQVRSVLGGLLVQEPDNALYDEWRAVTQKKPSKAESRALLFAWKFAKHVKSNAIVVSNAAQLLGVGAGQMSRIDAVELALRKAAKAGLSVKGAVLASDAFFPFPDSIGLAAGAGITAVVQPGGSLKDAEVIKAADELGISMVFTGVRHFKH